MRVHSGGLATGTIRILAVQGPVWVLRTHGCRAVRNRLPVRWPLGTYRRCVG